MNTFTRQNNHAILVVGKQASIDTEIVQSDVFYSCLNTVLFSCAREGITSYGPSIKYVTLFSANFYPLSPLSHFVTHPGTPKKSMSHISDPPPNFLVGLVQKIRTKAPCTNSLKCSRGFVREGLSGGLWSGRFCPGGFLSIPPSVTIHASVTTES